MQSLTDEGYEVNIKTMPEPTLEEIERVQSGLHALHAAMRVRVVHTDEEFRAELDELSESLGELGDELSLEEKVEIRREVHEVLRRQERVTPLLILSVELQNLIEILRLFGKLDWEEEDRKAHHLRKILVLLMVIQLLLMVLAFQRWRAEELERIRRKLPK